MAIYADVHLRTWPDLEYLLDVVHFHRECHNYSILKKFKNYVKNFEILKLSQNQVHMFNSC
jgi:hypothetical protein